MEDSDEDKDKKVTIGEFVRKMNEINIEYFDIQAMIQI